MVPFFGGFARAGGFYWIFMFFSIKINKIQRIWTLGQLGCLQISSKSFIRTFWDSAGARPSSGRGHRCQPQASRARKSHFRPMPHGPEPVDMGTPYFFHTFQRRSNRDPAIVLEGSMGRDEICVKGKSFMTPISFEPMGAANDRPPQSETSWYSTIGWLSSWLASLAA